MDLNYNKTPRYKVSSNSLEKLDNFEDLCVNIVDVQDTELKIKLKKENTDVKSRTPEMSGKFLT